MARPLTVAGVFAHPDDETWSLAGSFALLVPKGVRGAVWTATRGQAGQIADGSGVRVVVTGGPDETALTAYVSDDGVTALDLGGRTGLPALVETLAGARTVVVGNTGPAHLAAEVGTALAAVPGADLGGFADF